MRKKSRRAGTLFYTTSLVLHAGAGVAIASIVVHRPPPTIPVTMASVEAPKHEEPPEPPPPPPPEPETPRPRHHRPRRAEPTPAEAPPPDAPPPPADAPPPPPDYGIALGNLGAGPGGIAVPVGDPGGARGPRHRRTARRSLTEAAPARVRDDGCQEQEVRPRPLSMPHPAYTDEAREAGVEGRVRVRITVDDTGHISNATVIAPLGHGLDESALAAIREASFEPATRCGRAVSTTFTISVRFTL